MVFLLDRIPVRDTYKDTRDQAIKLKGPVTLVRILFLLEVAAFCAAFAVSFYLATVTYTTETLIGFEILSSPYKCAVLSPKSTGEYLSTTSSECVQYSSMRYTYDDCVSALSSSQFDVCSYKNRDDYTITLSGISASDDPDDGCFDVLLADDYRFCHNSEITTSVIADNLVNVQFPTAATAPTVKYSDVFFFTQASGSIQVISVPFLSTSIVSDVISNREYSVFLIATNTADGQSYLYQLSVDQSTAKILHKITYPTNYGITFGLDSVFGYSLQGSTGTIYQHKLNTNVFSTMTVDCTAYISSKATPYDKTLKYRYISYSITNDFLYVMCTTDTSYSITVQVQGMPPLESTVNSFSFLEVDFDTAAYTIINSDLLALNYTDANGGSTGMPINTVSQVWVVNNIAFAYTGE